MSSPEYLLFLFANACGTGTWYFPSYVIVTELSFRLSFFPPNSIQMRLFSPVRAIPIPNRSSVKISNQLVLIIAPGPKTARQ